MLRLWWRNPPGAVLARSRSFTASTKVEERAANGLEGLAVYHDRILRKWNQYEKTTGELPAEATDRTVAFFMDRGINETKAVRIVSRFITLIQYREEAIQSKIDFLKSLGISDAKINTAIISSPSILGNSIEKYEALINWYIAHGVPQSKSPQLLTLSIEGNLDPKVDFFKSIGFSDEQITRILSKAPGVLASRMDSLRHKIDYMVGLGVPRDQIPRCISNVPSCLHFKVSRIQDSVDTLDEILGEGTGVRMLTTYTSIVTYNIDGLRRSFKFLTSIVGFTPEQLQNLTNLGRSVDGILRPRFEFLKARGVDTLATRSWIRISNRVFMEKYPDFENYLDEYKVHQKEKKSSSV